MEVSGDGLDLIRISGIRHYGYTGFFPEEQVLGQWFEVNLSLWLDLATTGANDQLENTLNYAEVVAEVTAVMDAARFKTLERLNTAILERVLAFAMGQVQPNQSALVHDQIESNLTFLGLQGMADPPRPEAKAAIRTCESAGIRVVMITGDHPVTALAVARELGLPGTERVVTGAELAVEGGFTAV